MNKQSGFSLVETLLTVTVITFVITASAQLTMNVGRSYERTSLQLDVDQSASRAVQWMTRDLQEAKQVVILSPTHLRVFYPQLEADGTYNRALLNAASPLDYYRGDANANPDPNGNTLVRSPTGEPPRIVSRGVIDVEFVSSNPSSVDITVRVNQSNHVRTASCEMIHRAIFLRNY